MSVDDFTRTVEAWLVGDWSSGEFQFLRSEMEELAELAHVESLEIASLNIEEHDEAPELILLALPRPGSVDQSEVDALVRQSPLTRIVAVAGTWCEGELRTGRPLTGVVRLYWHELPRWWRAAKAALAAGESPPWSVALDNPLAGREITEPTYVVARPAHVIVDSVDHAVFTALSTALLPYGLQGQWQPRHRPERWDSSTAANCAVAIWDGSQLDAKELANLTAFAERMSEQGVSVIALLDFPRAEHMEMARKVGVAEVIAKPYQVAGLVQVIERVLSLRG